jgi:hypothetical protein
VLLLRYYVPSPNLSATWGGDFHRLDLAFRDIIWAKVHRAEISKVTEATSLSIQLPDIEAFVGSEIRKIF